MKKGTYVLMGFLCVCCVVGIAYGVTMLSQAGSDYAISDSEYESMQESYVIKSDSNIASNMVATTGETQIVLPYEIKFSELQEINPDVCAWIVIDGTEVNYPVVYSKDNKNYLRTTMEGKNCTAGSIFMDCCCTTNFTTLNTILYGHNMKNGSMFATLHDYKDSAFYEKHPYVFICTPEKQTKYGILSVHETRFSSDNYKTAFTEKEYEQFLFGEKEQALYETTCAIDKSKRVVTLSTCVNGSSQKRLVMTLQEVESYQVGDTK